MVPRPTGELSTPLLDEDDRRNIEQSSILAAAPATPPPSTGSPPPPPPARPSPPILYRVIVACLIACMGAFSFGFSVGYTSPALASLSADLHLPTSSSSLFSSLLSLGAMAGAASSGSYSDSFGRITTLSTSAALFLLGWSLISLASNFPILLFGRFATGVAVGLSSFVVPVYISEISPPSLRGRLASLNQLSITIGILLVYCVGRWAEGKWRAIALAGTLPAALLLGGLFLIPESPSWLSTKQGPESARKLHAAREWLGGEEGEGEEEEEDNAEEGEILRLVRGTRGGRDGAEAGGGLSTAPAAAAGAATRRLSSSRMDFLSLFSAPRTRKPLLVAAGLMILQQLSGVNGIIFFASSIFATAGFQDPFLPSFTVALASVLITLCSSLLMDLAGRKKLLILSSTGMGLSCCALAGAFLLQSSNPSPAAGLISVASCVCYIIAFSLGMGSIPWIIMAEVFPPDARGPGGSVVVLTNWLFCFLFTASFQSLLAWSASGSFALFGAICFLAALFTHTCVPETKGRSLEEIERFFAT